MLDRRGFGADRVIEREWAVDLRSGDLATIGHLAQSRGLDRRRHGGVDALRGGEDRHADLGDTHGVRQVDGVLDDVDLVGESRRDRHRGVGDDQGVGVAGHVHDEALRNAPSGAQAGLARHHGGHDLIGVQAALHQRFGAARPHDLHRLGRRSLAVGGVDELEGADVELGARGHLAYASLGAHQDGDDQLKPRRLDRALQ